MTVMLMRSMTNLLVGFLWATLLFISPSLVFADQAQYIYDDLGRLSQVIDGQGNVATYQYDAVGNLLSITRNTGGVGAPTITAFTPNSGNAGETVNVSLTGTNLTGASLATTNPGILFRNVVTTPTAIREDKRGQQLSFQSSVEWSIFDASSKNDRTQSVQEPRSEDGPGSPMPRYEPIPSPDAKASDV